MESSCTRHDSGYNPVVFRIPFSAEVAKSVDAVDSKSTIERCAGSSPAFGTTYANLSHPRVAFFVPEIQWLHIFFSIVTLSSSTDFNVHIPTDVGTDDGISGSIMLVPTGGISMVLTDIKIRTAKPTDKQYKLTDGSGMHLLVHPNGSKYWRLQYRFGGKQKMLASGYILKFLLQMPELVVMRLVSCWQTASIREKKREMIRLSRKKLVLSNSLLLDGMPQIKSGRKNIAVEC